MDKQQASPNKAVIGAALFLVLAAAALGGAVYYFDGARVLADLPRLVTSADFWASIIPSKKAPTSDDSSATVSAPVADELDLPNGMPASFALRLWQEQVDSQDMIGRLVNGDVRRMTITKVSTKGDNSELTVRVTLRDGNEVPGQITMRRFGDAWFVSTATAEERLSSSTPAGAIPSADQVDIELLNTVIAEQLKGKTTTQEYVDGKVLSIDVEKPEMGPNTVRIPVIMNEDHETAYADLVAIKHQADGKSLWFIARFNKTRSEPLEN